MKLLYLAGWGRSGSTLLMRILGQGDGFFAAGETFFLWRHGLLERRRCGCGISLPECPTWRAILTRALGPWRPTEVAAIEHGQSALVRHRSLLVGRRGVARRARNAPELERLGRLYATIGEVTGARVVIDSSHLSAFGHLLGLVPSLELYVVHLVRDPRAVAFSWGRQRLARDGGPATEMARHGAARAALLWSAQQLLAERLWGGSPRYLRLRYEDFVAHPEPTVRRILGLLDEEAGPLPFVGTHRVRLGPDHTVQGNPNRFNVGEVEIRADDEWRARMGRFPRTVVTALTWPIMCRYGYLGRARAPRTR